MSNQSSPALAAQKCRWCRADILWLTNRSTGKPAPVDARPCEHGNLLVNASERKYAVIPASQRAAYAGQLHMNHWATCEKAAAHKKPTPGGDAA